MNKKTVPLNSLSKARLKELSERAFNVTETLTEESKKIKHDERDATYALAIDIATRLESVYTRFRNSPIRLKGDKKRFAERLTALESFREIFEYHYNNPEAEINIW